MGNGYLLGYDIGRSFVRATLLESETGQVVATAASPVEGFEILTPEQGWAEQDPSGWWENVKLATALLRRAAGSKLDDTGSIGISYQMHGLVLVDKNLKLLRPAIVSGDSRAAEIGEQAFYSLGEEACMRHLLNSPGNFTASRVKWVMENEYSIYKQVHKMMLPGDYIGMMMTGDIFSTPAGLSEGILWDFAEGKIAEMVLKQYNIQPGIIPDLLPAFYDHGVLSEKSASELGLKRGIKLAYRAGDQLSGAYSLKVLNPGECFATAGSSGSIFGVADKPVADPRSRLNTFLHVNHAGANPRFGVLVGLNSAGLLYGWLKKNVVTFGSDTLTYNQMNRLAELIPAGSEGLTVLPYGSGAETTLENRTAGAAICNLDLNQHSKAHLLRAGQEGIVFALKHGAETMSRLGVEIREIRAASGNLFLSPLFGEAFSTVMNARVSLFEADASHGAARGAGVGSGTYGSVAESFVGLKPVKVIEPNMKKRESYLDAYMRWHECLMKILPDERRPGF